MEFYYLDVFTSFIIDHKRGAFSSTLKDSPSGALYNWGYCVRMLLNCSGRKTQTLLFTRIYCVEIFHPI